MESIAMATLGQNRRTIELEGASLGRSNRASLDVFFELSDDLMGLTDFGTGRWTLTNRAFTTHLGYPSSELLGARACSIVHDDDLPRCEHAARALASGKRTEFAGRMRTKSGGYRLVSWTLEPRPQLRAVYCVGRILKEAGNEPGPQGSNISNCLEAARAFAFTWQRSTDVLDLHPAASTVLKRPASALSSGRSYLELIDPADRDQLSSKIAAATRATPHFNAHYRISRPAGSQVWVEEVGQVVFTPDGRKCGIVGMCQDVTSKKMSEASMELAMHEMTHRAKNILTVVQAVLQFTKADSVEAYAAAINNRVKALARVQGLLANDRWSGVDLRSIVCAEFEPFGGLDGDRLSAEGPPVRIASHAVQILTLVIHELATNAAKYGALSVPGGLVSLSWSVGASGLEIVWRELNGPPVSPPQRKGFGHTMLSASLSHIAGSSRLDFRPEGLVAKIQVPDAALARGRNR